MLKCRTVSRAAQPVSLGRWGGTRSNGRRASRYHEPVNGWLRGIFAIALLGGLIYLAYAINLHVQLTRVILMHKDFRDESSLVVLLSWIWSSVPVALLWCCLAFYALTLGMGFRLTRVVVLAVGLIALASVLTVVVALMLPVRKL